MTCYSGCPLQQRTFHSAKSISIPYECRPTQAAILVSFAVYTEYGNVWKQVWVHLWDCEWPKGFENLRLASPSWRRVHEFESQRSCLGIRHDQFMWYSGQFVSLSPASDTWGSEVPCVWVLHFQSWPSSMSESQRPYQTASCSVKDTKYKSPLLSKLGTTP